MLVLVHQHLLPVKRAVIRGLSVRMAKLQIKWGLLDLLELHFLHPANAYCSNRRGVGTTEKCIAALKQALSTAHLLPFRMIILRCFFIPKLEKSTRQKCDMLFWHNGIDGWHQFCSPGFEKSQMDVQPGWQIRIVHVRLLKRLWVAPHTTQTHAYKHK